MHLVLISRKDPFLPISTLRARDQVTEVRTHDLRFTPEEAASYLRTALGDLMDEASAATLTEKAEGWITGLRLAVLSLRHQPDSGAKMLEMAANSSYVTDYFFEEVLAGQAPAIHRYLLSTAIPYRFCASLCDPLRAARLVEQNRLRLLDDEKWYVLKRWLSRLPDRIKRERPELLLA